MELFAYLDAGTGSIIIQAVIGAIVGIGVFVKTFWHRIKKVFSRPSKTSPADSAKNTKAS